MAHIKLQISMAHVTRCQSLYILSLVFLCCVNKGLEQQKISVLSNCLPRTAVRKCICACVRVWLYYIISGVGGGGGGGGGNSSYWGVGMCPGIWFMKHHVFTP